MSQFYFGQDPTVTKRCPHCDTALEFEPITGGRLVFTAHDEQFCHVATRERAKTLERVLLAQREAYERRMKKIERDVDAMLAKHGLPSLHEQANTHEARARMTAQLCGLGVPPDLLTGGRGGR